MPTEVHIRQTELGVFWIPADTDIPMQYKIIGNTLQDMQKLVGGYITVVRSELMPGLRCGCEMVMVVDEEGRLKHLEENLRAQILWPYSYSVLGDVFLIGEGPVHPEDFQDGISPDFVGLPPEFNTWEGPGNPIPGQLNIFD